MLAEAEEAAESAEKNADRLKDAVAQAEAVVFVQQSQGKVVKEEESPVNLP